MDVDTGQGDSIECISPAESPAKVLNTSQARPDDPGGTMKEILFRIMFGIEGAKDDLYAMAINRTLKVGKWLTFDVAALIGLGLLWRLLH